MLKRVFLYPGLDSLCFHQQVLPFFPGLGPAAKAMVFSGARTHFARSPPFSWDFFPPTAFPPLHNPCPLAAVDYRACPWAPSCSRNGFALERRAPGETLPFRGKVGLMTAKSGAPWLCAVPSDPALKILPWSMNKPMGALYLCALKLWAHLPGCAHKVSFFYLALLSS